VTARLLRVILCGLLAGWAANCKGRTENAPSETLRKFTNVYFSGTDKKQLLTIVDSTAYDKLAHEMLRESDSIYYSDDKDSLCQVYTIDSAAVHQNIIAYSCGIQCASEISDLWLSPVWIITVQYRNDAWKIIDYRRE